MHVIKYLLLLFPTFAFGQLADNYNEDQYSTYITPSVGTQGETYLRAEIENTLAFGMMQASVQTNIERTNLQLKLGFGWNQKDWRLYIFMPYLNYSVDERRYNTPFCAEGFWNPRSRWVPQIALNIDVYKNSVVPSLRAKMLINRFIVKEKRYGRSPQK